MDVVIVTRDRPAALTDLLRDIGRASPAPGNVIVVDDSERPPPWGEQFPGLPLDVVRPSPRAFLTRAKNLGWRRSAAEVVAFVDDDNRIPPDLLGRLTDDLDRNPGWGAVMPGVLYHRRPDLVWVYATPFRSDRWGFALLGRNAPRDRELERGYLPTDALPNLSVVRTGVLRELGGFEERLRVNSSADLCQRAKRAGWEVWADPRVLTFHDVDPPGVPGYWGAHTVGNPERCRDEVADWILFQRRWQASQRLFVLRASYHATGFLLPQLLASVLRPDGRPLRLLPAMIRGYRDGLGAAHDRLPGGPG